jgi:hypothetical protein
MASDAGRPRQQQSDGGEQLAHNHLGLARLFFAAVAKAQHDGRVRALLAGLARTRPNVAAVLWLGEDEAGEDAGGLVLVSSTGCSFKCCSTPRSRSRASACTGPTRGWERCCLSGRR